MADLARHIRLPLEFDSWPCRPTARRRRPSGVVRIPKDLDHDLEGSDVSSSRTSSTPVSRSSTCSRTWPDASPRRWRSRPCCGRANPAGPIRPPVRRLRHPERVRRRLRAGLLREVPEPALHRDAEPGGPRDRLRRRGPASGPGATIAPTGPRRAIARARIIFPERCELTTKQPDRAYLPVALHLDPGRCAPAAAPRVLGLHLGGHIRGRTLRQRVPGSAHRRSDPRTR